MKLAHITLKVDRFGNTVRRNYVTPAEVMLLTAEHRQNAGGNPILSVQEVAESSLRSLLADAEAERDKLQAKYDIDQDDTSITEEIRERRITSLRSRIVNANDRIDHLNGLIAISTASPANEKRRLVSRYGAKKVEVVFPGRIPQIPSSFEEAREAGNEATTFDPNDHLAGHIAVADGKS